MDAGREGEGEAARRVAELLLVNRRNSQASEGAVLALSDRSRRLEALALTDGLTGLPNRRAMEERLSDELARCARDGLSLAVLLVDLDHFKAVNDTHGHAAGDQVLRGAGALLAASARAMDGAGRWGGEEFVLVLPDAGPEAAREVAERVRRGLEGHVFPPGMRVTASIGLAMRPGNGGTQADLLAAADRAMYRAKEQGRNRVCMAEEGGPREASWPGERDGPAAMATAAALLRLCEAREPGHGARATRLGALAAAAWRGAGGDEAGAARAEAAGHMADVGVLTLGDRALAALRAGDPGPEAAAHAAAGEGCLRGVPGLRELAAAVRSHHERWGGGGYPDNLAREAIPPLARAVAAAEAYLGPAWGATGRAGEEGHRAGLAALAGAAAPREGAALAAHLAAGRE